jgi:hypothetical protein
LSVTGSPACLSAWKKVVNMGSRTGNGYLNHNRK